MLILVFALGIGARAHRFLQMYAPSNAVVARVRQERPRVRIAAGLLLVSATLLAGALVLADWVVNGGPGWLNLVTLVAVWDAFKFTLLALAVLLRSGIARMRRVESSRGGCPRFG